MKLSNSFAAVLGCLLLLGGCNSSTGAASNPGVAAASNSGAAPARVTGNAPADVKSGLQSAAMDLTGRASRTIMPSKRKPQFRKAGKEYIATYKTVDQNSVATEVRKGTSSATPYVGVISYTEKTLECRGKTKNDAANSSNCRSAGSSNRKELIRYDGKSKKWVF